MTAGGKPAPEAFWRREDGAYFATPVGTGPWRASSIGGRAVCGLLGFEIERLHLEPGFVPARFTVDLYALAGFAATMVETRVIREGGRMKLIAAELVSGGTSCARATCQLLRYTAAPPGRVWAPEDWQVPAPDSLSDDPNRLGRWQFRQIAGGLGQVARKRIWVRDYHELVAGVPLGPFARVALATDFTGPLSTGGERGIEYINTDAAVYLHRLPRSEWLGFDVIDHQASDGVGLGQTRLYDLDGPIGFGAASALAQRMPK